MKHNISLEGYAFSIRPVEIEDAEFIVAIRTPDRSRFMNQIERSVEAQRRWLEDHFSRPDDYYFVVERKKDLRREGLLGLLDFDHTNHSAQWGRFIMQPGSLAASEAALLTTRLAFGMFDLNEIWGTVLKDNRAMASYLESLGFHNRETVTMSVNGKMLEQTKYVLTKDRWKEFESKITKLALFVVDKLR